MIEFTTASTDYQLQQILNLQRANLKRNLSQVEVEKQGFVSAEHDLPLLKKMNSPHSHVIAIDREIVVGYALVMTLAMRDEIPMLVEMIDIIDLTSYHGSQLKDCAYVVMGQVCISRGYRGQGIFSGLYEGFIAQMAPYFQYVITGVSMNNPRSLRAHKNVGFEILSTFEDENGEWANIILEIKKKSNGVT